MAACSYCIIGLSAAHAFQTGIKRPYLTPAFHTPTREDEYECGVIHGLCYSRYAFMDHLCFRLNESHLHIQLNTFKWIIKTTSADRD